MHYDIAPIQAARENVTRGLAVLPLYPANPATGACTCPAGEACALPGAHPLHGLGPRDATCDLARIEAWWADAPDANVGIALGAQHGVLVVRVDTNVPATAQLLTQLTETGAPVASHPSGLIDAYLAAAPDDALCGARFNGVVVLGDDTVVVAPPSVVPGGRVEWVASVGNLADLPCLPWTVADLAGVMRGLVGQHATARAGSWSAPQGDLDAIRSPVDRGLEPVLIAIDKVTAAPVKWLLPGRIPLGAITDFTANPEAGKSTLSIALVALVTRGAPFPPTGEPLPDGGALILCAEDDPATTIRPRLEAAGADLTRVAILNEVVEDGVTRGLQLPRHVAAIEKACEGREIRIIVIDPGTDFASGVDIYHDLEIRDLLRPLTDLARRHDLAVVFIRHLGKRPPALALNGGLGGVGFGAVARAGLRIRSVEHGERILESTKSSLGPRPAGVKFRIVGVPGPEGSSVGRIEWLGEVEAGATDVDDPTKAELAERFLVEVLREGETAKKTLQELARANGIGFRYVESAKAALGVTSRWVGRTSMWRMPGTGNDDGGKS